ncbi:hypothetical protein U2F26_32870 [Micromonospora sp. 4G57]|uniref:Uncharacterized protein n=1 Tax=Micromonospora sicca TaxID=2202420 RepID=A0ABU5JNM1_9ACTN|nr:MULTISPECIES: hypothetical protein [unclassified Micromonospora]MDZ5447445.1 hypothetical protein [Micromonospora sp. 4G57]MDZ5494181.1 hypothetical protein [Micromonospora sp. 4G53]
MANPTFVVLLLVLAGLLVVADRGGGQGPAVPDHHPGELPRGSRPTPT